LHLVAFGWNRSAPAAPCRTNCSQGWMPSCCFLHSLSFTRDLVASATAADVDSRPFPP
jgi:hypothetical protein